METAVKNNNCDNMSQCTLPFFDQYDIDQKKQHNKKIKSNKSIA